MNGRARDRFGRPLRSLRLSVTDRCNLRCGYCMPEEHYGFLPQTSLLSLDELAQLARAFALAGANRVRLTGGEPLLRAGLEELIAALASQRHFKELALTTNGVLLAQKVVGLKAAGLTRVTVSLDTLRAERFFALTRRDEHRRVLEGVAAAAAAGFAGPLKLDTVVMRGFNDDELVPLLDFAAERGAELRFIEYMDVGGATRWSPDKVVSRAELLARLAAQLGPIAPLAAEGSAPAERFQLADGRVFGIIASVTQPFCGSCDRARVTADGHWLTCLYARRGVDLRTPLRQGAGVEALARLVAFGWRGRAARGAEERRALAEGRGPWPSTADDLLAQMHARGG